MPNAVFPSTEEVADCHQSDCSCVALRGCGELHGEAVLPLAACVWSDVQQPLDVLQAVLQGFKASPGLCQNPETRGERQFLYSNNICNQKLLKCTTLLNQSV